MLGLILFVLGVMAVARLAGPLADDGLADGAFGPVALLPEVSSDDGAGDPIIADELATPLTGVGADASTLDSERLLAAAASPIAIVADSSIPGACPALLQRTFNRLQTGKSESLCQFEGKVLLVVNTASYCGYTHQFEGLEAMYRKYKDRGLVVVGFPSNDFGQQEPGSNAEIAEFCRLTYGVEFPMFEKSSVSSLAGNPLFTELASRTGKAPQWNFHKYVIDRSGVPVGSFTSQTEPGDRALVKLVERLLADRPGKS